MSKKSKKTVTSTPIIYDTSASINVNGQNLASASSTKNGANVSYNMNPLEQAAFEYSNQSFYDNLPNVNVFSDETQKSLNNEVNAYLNKGINTINSTYTPMIRQIQNDAARRFGNLNNSVFMDNLNNIEAQRANAISDLAGDVNAKRSELVNNELLNRYNYLNFLNNYQNQVFNNMLSALGMSNNFLNTNNNQLNGRPSSTTTSSNSSGINFGDVASLTRQVLNLASGFIK